MQSTGPVNCNHGLPLQWSPYIMCNHVCSFHLQIAARNGIQDEGSLLRLTCEWIIYILLVMHGTVHNTNYP